MMADLAIQIVNYNTKKYLTGCVDGVINDLKNSKISYKILVLDNHSGDDLKDLEVKYKPENIEFYYSDKNVGFGAGHNLLSKKIESKYILILNPDLKFLENKTIERLIESFNNNIAVLGPKLINGKSEQSWDHGEIYGFLGWFSQKIGSSHWRKRNNPTEVAWVSGAFFLILRDIFNKLGGFDENFFLYKEEEDLCLRIRKLGYKVLYYPLVKVFHFGSVVASKNKFFIDSDECFFEKHFKNKNFIFYNIIKLFNLIKHKIINKILHE